MLGTAVADYLFEGFSNFNFLDTCLSVKKGFDSRPLHKLSTASSNRFLLAINACILNFYD